jgi:ABC-2 type transport system permease protein
MIKMNTDKSTPSSFKFNRLLGLIKKEAYQIVRDPSSMIIAFGLPALLIFIFGYAVTLDIQELKIGMVVEDTSPDANLFVESFANSPYFNVTQAYSRHDLERQLLASKLRGMIVIPFYFDRDLTTRNIPAPIQVIADASETNTANLLQDYVESAWRIWLNQRDQIQGVTSVTPVAIEERIWYNPDNISRNFLLPGSIAVIMTIIGTLLTALVVAREWERGTMEALMATSVTIGEILWGKIIPYFILGLGSMFVCVIVVVFIFDVPFRGSVWLLFIVTSLFLATSLCLGLNISTLARNQFVASQGALYTAFLPAFILSGFIFEIQNMPRLIQLFTYLLPARYFVSSLQTLFLTGNVYVLILKSCVGITLIGLVFMTLVRKQTRKRLD